MNHASAHDPAHDPNDINLVELWLRRDPIRWAAGAMAGLFSGVISMAFAMVLAAALGTEVWFPIKVAALPFLGPEATEFGVNMKPLIVGAVAHELLAMMLGMIYAHFTATNSLPALLGAGFVWGTFSWIFIFNLFVPSFRPVLAAQISQAAGFPIMMVFGLALTSVAFFDRALRGGRS